MRVQILQKVCIWDLSSGSQRPSAADSHKCSQIWHKQTLQVNPTLRHTESPENKMKVI